MLIFNNIDLHAKLASRILTQKEPFPRSEFTPALHLDMLDADRSPNAESPRSSRDRLISMVKRKERKKEWIRKMKKPERPRRSVSNFVQKVFDYALEDACVKVASVLQGC